MLTLWLSYEETTGHGHTRPCFASGDRDSPASVSVATGTEHSPLCTGDGPTRPSTYLSPVMVMVKPSYSFPWSLRLGTLVFTVNPSFVLVLNCFRGEESSRYSCSSHCQPAPTAVRGGLDARAPRSPTSRTHRPASSDRAQAPAQTPGPARTPQGPHEAAENRGTAGSRLRDRPGRPHSWSCFGFGWLLCSSSAATLSLSGRAAPTPALRATLCPAARLPSASDCSGKCSL